jgi:RHS repeat-associated protein
MLSAETHRGNREASGEESYGRFLYNFYRTYDPATGRYLEADPIGQWGGVNVYVYARSNPARSTDPFGLINFLAGGGVTGAAPTGAEASGGIVVNPGLGGEDADAGVFGSAGATAGLNVSADAFVGYVEGGMEDVSGTTVNQNVTAGPLSVTTFHDPTTGEVVGATVGFGPSATPAGYSVAYSVTGTLTLKDLLAWLAGLLSANPCE